MSEKLNQFIILSKIRNPSADQFKEAARLSSDRSVSGKASLPDWLPFHWLRKFGRKGNFAQYVARSIDAKCGICDKPLGFKDRSDHSPWEHGHCHSIVSESCLG